MHDFIETVGRSLIHHGAHNDRAYLMKLHGDDSADIVRNLDTLALSRGYSKIFAKVPEWTKERFLDGGYLVEARIPGFYAGKHDACFMGKFFTDSRAREQHPELLREVLAVAREKADTPIPDVLPEGFTIRTADEEDAEEMAKIYREVFASYPFPIHDPGFLRSAMKDSTLFFIIGNRYGMAALSSAEMDRSSASAEMTDFATKRDSRGNGLALFLLRHMEGAVKSRGIRSLFTIARAYSHGMNITFARNGYSCGGTLTNNTNISGRLESMNVWYKIL